jgi:hypothetical protein
MFVTIRRYSPKNGALNKASLELLRRQIQEQFLPIARQVRGFRGYYVVNVNDRELLTLSLCETPDGEVEFSRCTADYTLRNPLIFELGTPEVVSGPVLAAAERPIQLHVPEHNGNGAAATALALWMDESRGMLLSDSER